MTSENEILNSKISTLETKLSSKASSSDLSALNSNLNSSISNLSSTVSGHTTSINNILNNQVSCDRGQIDAKGTLLLHIVSPHMYLFSTEFVIHSGDSLTYLTGANGNKINSGQVVTVHSIYNAGNIEFSVSNVSGHYDEVTVTNKMSYTVRYSLCQLY